MTDEPTVDHAALVTAAAIGTRTRHVDLTGLPPELAALVPAPDEPGDLAPFLAAAAGYAVARRGSLPVTVGVEPLTPPERETRPLAPPAVQALVPRLVDTLPVLLEALRMVAGAGHRIGVDALPVLLSRGPEVRAATVPVMGEAGRWLCALNPAWSPLLQPSRSADRTPPAPVTPDQLATALAALASADTPVAPTLESLPVPWPRDLAIPVGQWLMARLSPPPAGRPRTPAPPSLWDRWAVAVPRPDAREAAVATQNAISAARHAGVSAAATTRAHRAVHILTLRSILHEEYP